jgi:hypothetical protein
MIRRLIILVFVCARGLLVFGEGITPVECGSLRACVAGRVDSTLIYLGRDHMRAERAYRVLSSIVDTRAERNMLRAWLRACAGPDNYLGIGEMVSRDECVIDEKMSALACGIAGKMGCTS